MDDFAGVSDVSEIGSLLESHRAALQLHCYRMTGSLQEAEDLAQESLLRAWRSYESFQGASSLRTWLYRIATNVCLDALKKRQPGRRLLRPAGPPADAQSPVGSPTSEILWLEPYPDTELPSSGETPEQAVIDRESISLAFLSILQLLPPRQRAILVLRDVLDWAGPEVAALLHTTVSAVDSALHRARATLAENTGAGIDSATLDAPSDAAARSLLRAFVYAWEQNDLQALIKLLHSDVTLSMPPFPAWYRGRESVGEILSLHPMGQRRRAGWHLEATGANGQPAFVLYRADQPDQPSNAFGIMALTVATPGRAASITTLTIFRDTALVPRFGFPLSKDFAESGRA